MVDYECAKASDLHEFERAATSARPLLILGTRPHALVVAELAAALPEYRVAGFVENKDRRRCEQLMDGLPIHWIDEISALAEDHLAVCSLATTRRDRFIEQAADLGLRFATLIHPQAHVSRRTAVGEGSRIEVGAIVAAFSHLGNHVVVNRGVTVGHHTRIGAFTTIQPGANIAGQCEIADRCYIGIGANIIDGIRIGSRAVIGAGSVVSADVPDRAMVMGLPARVVKRNIDGK